LSVAQGVEHLLSKHKTPSSTPILLKKKKRKKEKEAKIKEKALYQKIENPK
jgi:hypothetical protein